MNVLAGPRLARVRSPHLPSTRAYIHRNRPHPPHLLHHPPPRPSSVRRRKPPLGDLLINHSPVIAIDERLCRASLGALSAHGGIRQISRRLYRRIIDRTLPDRSVPAVQLSGVRRPVAKNHTVVPRRESLAPCFTCVR